MINKVSQLLYTECSYTLVCSYHLHSGNHFLSTWGAVMLKNNKNTTQVIKPHKQVIRTYVRRIYCIYVSTSLHGSWGSIARGGNTSHSQWFILINLTYCFNWKLGYFSCTSAAHSLVPKLHFSGPPEKNCSLRMQHKIVLHVCELEDDQPGQPWCQA